MNKKNYLLILIAMISYLGTPLNAQVTVSNALSGNGTYTTLRAAMVGIGINQTTYVCANQATANIEVAISGDTNETATVEIGQGNWASLKIYPTATATISGSVIGRLISFRGGDNVTIDGRIDRTGSTKSLTIANTYTTASTSVGTIILSNSAENNTIQYCVIRGAMANASTGTVRFVAASAGNGNDNNVITHNTITGLDDNALTNRAMNAIFINGAALYINDNCQVTYNDFPQFLQPAGTSVGVNLVDAYSKGWTISNNNFYEETGTLTPTVSAAMYAIQIGGGNGFTISNNYIGGSAVSCGGSQLTKTNAFSNTFVGLNLTLTTGGTVNSIQNNTIKNISWSNSSTQSFKGIAINTGGDVNIGTETGNTIGASTGTNSIIFTPTGASTFTGIETSSAGTVDIEKNTVGSIKTDNGSATAVTFYGINKSGAYAGTLTISNNTIGSVTEANSINVATVVGTQPVYAINCAGTGVNTISNNTISNINNASTTSGSISGIRINAGTASTTTVNANFIQKLYMPSSTSSSIYGVNIVAGLGTYTNNIVSIGYGSTNTANIYGIYDTGALNSNSNVYHNTVVIGGSPASLALASYALLSAANANTRDFRNNILYNERSNTGTATGNHYAIRLSYTSAGTLTLDHNDYWATGTTGFAGYYNNAGIAKNVSTIVTGLDAGSVNADPQFDNVSSAAAIGYKARATLAGTDLSAAVPYDFSGLARTSQIGAFNAITATSNSGGNISASGLTDLQLANTDLTVTSGELILDATKTVHSLTVAPGAKLTLSSGSLTATNGITLQSSTAGTATFVDNNNSSPQAVTATVQQYFGSATARNYYITAPISGATVPSGQTYYSYDETGSNIDLSASGTAYWKPEAATSTLDPRKGYITQTSGVTTLSYTGTLNTGIQTPLTLTRTNSAAKPGFNLVANPYPSYLDWKLVSAANTGLTTTAWFRTKDNSGGYIFATVNVATPSSPVIVAVDPNTTITTLIPPMQAYWVRVNAVGSTTYNVSNTMRAHVDNTANKFKAPAQSSHPLLRLRVSNGTNADETVVLLNENATNDMDKFDSPKMSNNSASVPEIYTQIGTEKLVINGIKEITYNTEIPIGFSTLSANDFSISANEISNFEAGTKVILLDKLNPTVETDLTSTAYNFSAPVTTANIDRFSLIFRTTGSTSGIDNVAKLNAQVFVNAANQITIISPDKVVYSTYNAVGQLVSNGLVASNRTVISHKFAKGMYVVRVLENGKELTKRVIIK